MTTPSHTAVGIGCAVLFPWPFNAIIAFLLHLWLDLFPEWYPLTALAHFNRNLKIIPETVKGWCNQYLEAGVCVGHVTDEYKKENWRDCLILAGFFLVNFIILAFAASQVTIPLWHVLICVLAANAMDLDTIIVALGGKAFWPCHPNTYKWASWVKSKVGQWQVNNIGAVRTGLWDTGMVIMAALIVLLK